VDYFRNFQKNCSKQTITEWAKIAESGVDVMICDFCQFSAKKLPFFTKTNVMIKFLQKLAVV
jgi:hypothetical protein